MSHKAFYQTFYQTEQLFRRADEVWSYPDVATEPLAPAEDVLVADVVVLEPPTIVDPVVPIHVPEPVAEVIAPTPEAIHPTVEPAQPEPAYLPEPAPATAEPPAERHPRKPATPMVSQKVLILVDEDLQPSDLLFLEKVLKAVNLDVEGVDLLNVHGTKNIDFAEVLRGKHIHHFFTFGVPFTRLNLDILMDRYQPVRFEGITFLMADPLPAIESDVALKKKLWEALKKIFQWR